MITGIPIMLEMGSACEALGLKYLGDKSYIESKKKGFVYIEVEDTMDRSEETIEQDIRIIKLIFSMINGISAFDVVCRYRKAAELKEESIEG
jgi:hypothetical protein